MTYQNDHQREHKCGTFKHINYIIPVHKIICIIMERKRPKSSINPRTAQRSCTHATPPKTYRVNQQDVYNYVRNSVH